MQKGKLHDMIGIPRSQNLFSVVKFLELLKDAEPGETVKNPTKHGIQEYHVPKTPAAYKTFKERVVFGYNMVQLAIARKKKTAKLKTAKTVSRKKLSAKKQ